jgi:hypothetical protein
MVGTVSMIAASRGCLLNCGRAVPRTVGDTNSFCKVTNFETAARNTLLWRVPGSMYIGHTSRLVEMVDLM